MTSPLASLLDRAQDRIAAGWAEALSRLRPSAYVYRPLEELHRLGRGYLTELVFYLDSDDPSRLREFVHREAALRLAMGFGAAEVVQGFLVFRDLAQELCGEVATDDEERARLLRSLTEATDFTVVEFVTQFQHLIEERASVQARELEQIERALVEQSVLDPVTDLFTAPFFDEHLAVEVKRAARYGRALSLMVCRLDNFEVMRGHLGERVAEEALQAIAGMLRTMTRDVDIKARTEEAEFSVALPETRTEPAFVVAERLRSEVADLRVLRGLGEEGRGELTASIGVGSYPDHGATARDLLEAVRSARERARMLGGNLVIQADEAAPAG